jgi:mycoketide-CoA synthase
VYARPEGEDGLAEQERAWTRHASGVLDDGSGTRGESLSAHGGSLVADDGVLDRRNGSAPDGRFAVFAQGVWPPQGAVQLDVEDLYDFMEEQGLEYGPVFQGLQAAWRRGEELFAEITLPEEEHDRAHQFGIHPALLDAALHTAGIATVGDSDEAGKDTDDGVKLPSSWGEVHLHATGASSLRLWLHRSENDEISLVGADESCQPVISIDSLVLRPVARELLRSTEGSQESLFGLDWIPSGVASSPPRFSSGEWAVLGTGDAGLERELEEASIDAEVYTDLASLTEAVRVGAEIPAVVLVDCSPEQEEPDGVVEPGADGARAVGGGTHRESSGIVKTMHASASRVLALVQAWLADERFSGSRMVFLTRSAVAAGLGDQVSGLAAAPIWGLVRSAQTESPDRFVLVDSDGQQASTLALGEALVTDEPQLALREGSVFVPRLARGSIQALSLPAGISAWRLGLERKGTLAGLEIVACPEAEESLGVGQVRIGVRAAGLNFRDVLIALGVYSGDEAIGGEGAGVVLEVGPGVDDLAPGDRVMGLLTGGFGPISVTDRRLVVPMPEGWSFVEGASVPVAFLTAYYSLVDLADLQRGESLLVHAAADGGGMAAVQLARHLGAEVFGTASPGKWGALRALGLDETRIASSRTLEFKERFLEATEDRGMDVVLDSLAREFVDASLDLLPDGGRFIEMSKTDLRDPGEVAEAHPGVAYRACDLTNAGPDRLKEMLDEVVRLFEQGALRPLPVTTWDMRHAPEAFRFLSQAHHVGKVVLTLPRQIESAGTVLITGGTDVLGGLVAKHLVNEHGVRSVVLASGQGMEADGASELTAELESLGARVTLATCDVTDRAQLAGVLQAIPQEYPLSAVVHAAGVLDDGVVESPTDERLQRVMALKADAAWHLHHLTADLDLQAFVLFSSAAGTFGNPGQGSCAAANAFLDALASYRSVRGLPGISIAWGQDTQINGITEQLQETDPALARPRMSALSSEEGLGLFDAVCASGEVLTIVAPMDAAALRVQARAGVIPALLRGLVRRPARRARGDAGGSLARRLAGVSESERGRVVLDLVRAEIADVLGHGSAETVEERRSFQDLGFDSLAAVELRNRLGVATGLRLPATLVFDYPTPTALVDYLLDQVALNGKTEVNLANVELDKLAHMLRAPTSDADERLRITERLRALLAELDGGRPAESAGVAEKIQLASDDEIFDFIDEELGTI